MNEELKKSIESYVLLAREGIIDKANGVYTTVDNLIKTNSIYDTDRNGVISLLVSTNKINDLLIKEFSTVLRMLEILKEEKQDDFQI